MKYESAADGTLQRTLISEESVVAAKLYAKRRKELCSFKRVMDIMIAGPLLVFLLPLLGVIALLVKLGDGGPVFFVQRRRGFGGRMFGCIKFRTMHVNADKLLAELLSKDADLAAEWNETQKLKKDPRITRLGLFLRKSSFDELPQLWNILKGEMSIVGPRPIVADEVRRYGELISAYDSVRPGVTGLWQVSGRNDTSYEARVALDAAYTANRTLLGDITIVLRTVPALFKSGAY